MFAERVSDLVVESVPRNAVLYKYNDMFEALEKRRIRTYG